MPSGALPPLAPMADFIFADDFKRERLGKQAPSQSLPPNRKSCRLSITRATFRSGRSAKIEKHLSAPLGVKNRFAQ
jgi:hypothetical protein